MEMQALLIGPYCLFPKKIETYEDINKSHCSLTLHAGFFYFKISKWKQLLQTYLSTGKSYID